MTRNTYLATVTFWRNARTFRMGDPIEQTVASCVLWNLATSPSASPRLKRAVLSVLGVQVMDCASRPLAFDPANHGDGAA